MPKKIADIRRAEIVQALQEAIAVEGISLPSYDHIAREGDMSRQLVRHYYRDPERMAADLCDRLAEGYRDLLMRGIMHAEPEDRLRVFLDFYFDRLSGKGLGKPSDDAIYDALFAFAGTSDLVRDRLAEQYAELRRSLADEIETAHPDLSQAGCRELAYLVVTQMYGHWRMRATLGMADADSRVPREAINRLIASYVEHYDERDGEDDVEPSSARAHSGTVEAAAP